MANREDLEKLFDAALHERKAPSRFGTPDEQVVAAPAVFQKAASVFHKAEDVEVSPFKADTAEAKPFAPAAASPFQAAPTVNTYAPQTVLDENAVKSLDHGLNAELEAILDKKIAKDKGKKRRDRVIFFLLLFGALGGGAGWLVVNPDKMEAIKKLVTEMRSASDPNAVAEEYKKSLEKVAVRGDQLGDATKMIGGKEVEGEDQNLDKEMKDVAGQDAGLSPGERQKKLKEKFDSMPKK